MILLMQKQPETLIHNVLGRYNKRQISKHSFSVNNKHTFVQTKKQSTGPSEQQTILKLYI